MPFFFDHLEFNLSVVVGIGQAWVYIEFYFNPARRYFNDPAPSTAEINGDLIFLTVKIDIPIRSKTANPIRIFFADLLIPGDRGTKLS